MPALNINCYVRVQQVEHLIPLVQMNILKDVITPLFTTPPLNYSTNEGDNVYYLYRIHTNGTKLNYIPQGNSTDGYKGYIYIPANKSIQNILIYDASTNLWKPEYNAAAIFHVDNTELVSLSYEGVVNEYKRYNLWDPYDVTNSLGAVAYSFQIK